jgi:prolyl-tRNA synthetase
MRYFLILLSSIVTLASCKSGHYGQKFDDTNSITPKELKQKLATSDTVKATVTGKVAAVCIKEGCWLNLDMEDGTVMLVRMKNHAFFVPKDIAGKTATVSGKAFIQRSTVEELKHYARDAGKSDEEIASITEPKAEPQFEAVGVYIK